MNGPDWTGSAGDYLKMFATPEDAQRQQMMAQAQPTLVGGQQQMPPQVGGQPTLGQAAEAAGTVPQNTAPNSYLQQYEQALQAARQMVAPAKKDYATAPGHTNILQNILTWGGAAVQAHENFDRYNQKVDDYNKHLELTAADLARDMVKTQADAESRSGQSILAQMGMALRWKQYEELVKDHQYRNFDQERRRAYQDTLPPLTSPEQAAVEESQGLGRKPSSQFPNRDERVRLQGSPQTGWNVGADTPMGKALGVTGSPAGGGDSLAKQPGESFADWNARRSDAKTKAGIEARTLAPTAATKTRAEAAPKVLGLIQEARKALDTAERTKSGVGPMASRWRSFKQGTVGTEDPAFTTYVDTVGMLHSLLMNMHTGSRSSEMLLKKFEGMGNPTHQSAANMRAMFNMAERYAHIVELHHGEESPDEIDAARNPTSIDPGTGGGVSGPRRLKLGEFLGE